MDIRPETEPEVTAILYSLGFRTKLLGFHYLRRGIMLALGVQGSKIVMGDLYDKIAEEFHTNASCVERAMRHAVHLSWENQEEFDGFRHLPPFMQSSTPRNSLLISYIAEEIRSEERRRIVEEKMERSRRNH